jgi:2-amino-4-hydroxy-6-hydroxymethyldihydropteridine diphosphokinase/dihydropteroate synthase
MTQKTSRSVVLGLGSNVGDSFTQLCNAVRALGEGKTSLLKNVKVAPLFASEALLLPDAPPEWNLPFLNTAVLGNFSGTPLELLALVKKIEHSLGRQQRGRWAPREIDIDILWWDNETITENESLQIPHKSLVERPFALWPLAALAPEAQIDNSSATALQLSAQWGFMRQNIPCSTWNADPKTQRLWGNIITSLGFAICQSPLPHTEIVGILNVTPDSFSDGGELPNAEAIYKRGLELYNAGARILDIGGESTRPQAVHVPVEVEMDRVRTAIAALIPLKKQFSLPPLLSLDTRHPAVAELGLSLGIDWLNDVEGFQNKDLVQLACGSTVDLVAMHSLSVPPHKDIVLDNSKSATQHILEWGQQKVRQLSDAGINPNRIILDPGIGFGKTPLQSFELIHHAHLLAGLGYRTLFGHSRKSFLAQLTENPAPQRDGETALLSALLSNKRIDYIRVHNVAKSAFALSTLGLP